MEACYFEYNLDSRSERTTCVTPILDTAGRIQGGSIPYRLPVNDWLVDSAPRQLFSRDGRMEELTNLAVVASWVGLGVKVILSEWIFHEPSACLVQSALQVPVPLSAVHESCSNQNTQSASHLASTQRRSSPYGWCLEHSPL